MALVGNISLLHKSPAKYTTGTAGFNDRANWNKPGMMRNRGDLTVSTLWKYDAVPAGMYAGTAFFPPQKTGAITSRNRARIDILTGALAVGGITTTGTADFSIVTNTPAGQLIAFGIGSASLLISTNTPLLTASLNAIGSASFVLTTNTPLLGAIASGAGSASVLFTMSATILPTNDASPLRTATASFTITGSLTPYAIGSMTGSTVDGGVLTVDAIAAGVLAAALTTPIYADIRKVKGQTFNGSGTPSDPWGP